MMRFRVIAVIAFKPETYRSRSVVVTVSGNITVLLIDAH